MEGEYCKKFRALQTVNSVFSVIKEVVDNSIDAEASRISNTPV